MSQELAKRVLGLIDLTTLQDDDTPQRIETLCGQACTPFGNTAAICIDPQFIQTADTFFQKHPDGRVPIATVVNFPLGNEPLADVLANTERAILDGANEIDAVIPYHDAKLGNFDASRALVAKLRSLLDRMHQDSIQASPQASKVLLKIIIESGELKEADLIHQASMVALQEGADFIKTSTGKVSVNATLESAAIMLDAILESGKDAGFKAAGGVRTVQEALAYLKLAEEKMGMQWLSARRFRFGASSLLGSVLSSLGQHAPNTQQTNQRY